MSNIDKPDIATSQIKDDNILEVSFESLQVDKDKMPHISDETIRTVLTRAAANAVYAALESLTDFDSRATPIMETIIENRGSLGQPPTPRR